MVAMNEAWVRLSYNDKSFVPERQGLARCEPSNIQELVEELDRYYNASADHPGGIVLELASGCPEKLIPLELKRAREEEHLLKVSSAAKLTVAREKVKALEKASFDISPALKKERLFQKLCIFTGEAPTLICGGYFSEHPVPCESCAKNRPKIQHASVDFSREHMNKTILAACRGARDGLITDDHLGLAIEKYSYRARTFEGDTYETSFLWAREEKRDRD